MPTPFEILKCVTAALAVQSSVSPTPGPAFPPSRGDPFTSLPTHKPTVLPATRSPTIRPSFQSTSFPLPSFVSLSGYYLSSCSIRPGESSEIKIYGKFTDGTIRNITRLAEIESSNPSVVKVTSNYTKEGGLILHGQSNGWAEIRYKNCLRTIKMTVWPQKGCFKEY